MAKILKIYTTSKPVALFLEDALDEVNKRLKEKEGTEVEVRYIPFKVPRWVDKLLQRFQPKGIGE